MHLIKHTSAILGSSMAIFSSGLQAVETTKPNIVFILADDMGIGDVSALNPKSAWQTPRIDELARSGICFTDAHSSSAVCTPSRYSIMTGRYAWRGQLKQGALNGYSPSLLEPGRLTLPEFLRSHGYTTAMFGKWHLGLDFKKSGPNPADIDYAKPFGGGPIAHGFDRFYGIGASLDMPPYVWLENDRVVSLPTGVIGDSPAPQLWRAGPIGADFVLKDVLPRLTEKTISFLDEHAAKDKRPFFLYLALTAPHTPTLAAKEFTGKTPTPYGDFVLNVDHEVGLILDKLEQLGLANDTLVIFSADNGYAPAGNIPRLQNFGHDSSGGFRGAKSDAFEGGHRVPFIVRWPGVTPTGTRSAVTVEQLDLFATCAELMRVQLPSDVAEDSSSMLALLRGGENAATGREAIVHHSGEGEFAIRQGKWKLILCPGSGGWSSPTRTPSPWTQPKPDNLEGLPPFQLFDLESDPAETTNRASDYPEIVQLLGRLMKTIVVDGRSTPGPPERMDRKDFWPQLKWMEQFR